MVVLLNRLMLSPEFFERKETFAKFFVSDLSHYIERTAEMAELLDEEVSAAIARAGLDPDDWQSELEPEVCNISVCRNDAEELHAMLCAIRDAALLDSANKDVDSVQ